MKKKTVLFIILGIVALICGTDIIFAGVFAINSGYYDRFWYVAERNLKAWVVLTVLALICYGTWLLISSMLKKSRSK